MLLGDLRICPRCDAQVYPFGAGQAWWQCPECGFFWREDDGGFNDRSSEMSPAGVS